ncbi:hypothetical protein ACFQU2_07515 [Siccirubricoccus deserti]
MAGKISVERQGAVAFVIIAHEAKLNTLNPELMRDSPPPSPGSQPTRPCMPWC